MNKGIDAVNPELRPADPDMLINPEPSATKVRTRTTSWVLAFTLVIFFGIGIIMLIILAFFVRPRAPCPYCGIDERWPKSKQVRHDYCGFHSIRKGDWVYPAEDRR